MNEPFVIPETIVEMGDQRFDLVGITVLKVERAYENMVGRDNPKYAISLDLTVVEPAEYAGQEASHNFILGTKDDPGSLEARVKPETFASWGGARFEKFALAAGVPIRGQNLEVVLSELKDRSVKARTTAAIEPAVYQFGAKKGQKNDYAGRYNLEWSQWMGVTDGPAPSITTTLRELRAKENNGTAGQQPSAAPATAHAAPPPPPSPAARAPMPPRGR